jgi:hypothetical protein
MQTKAERREKRKANNNKMIVTGRSIFTLSRIKAEKAIKANKQLNENNRRNNN